MTMLDIETGQSRYQVEVSRKSDGIFSARYVGIALADTRPFGLRSVPRGGIIVEGAVEAPSLDRLTVKYRAVVTLHSGDILLERTVAAEGRL